MLHTTKASHRRASWKKYSESVSPSVSVEHKLFIRDDAKSLFKLIFRLVIQGNLVSFAPLPHTHPYSVFRIRLREISTRHSI